ncbi:MAG: hybrid sensor histidine kinase/response regulator [Candidatus Vecturithrix sp.]|jgi:signal transduction histidine kinase|nr:hybrid sensor histidine kinase/response regulator [Candidatus Vecturithrix sp.]
MTNHEKNHILLVDDMPENLQVLIEVFKTHGFEITIAQSGEETLKITSLRQPHIILLDVMMPGMNGFETCRRLKSHQDTREIPVIFMTALADKAHKMKGFEVGGVDYVTKPFHAEEVLARVNAHLLIRKQYQQLQDQNAIIREQREQLRELNASKDQFLSIISHDLQSPFAGIFTLAELIKHEVYHKRYDKIESTVDQLQASVENYHALLQNLLSWTKIQQGLIEIHPQPIDLQLIFARNLALFNPQVQQKQLSINQPSGERIVLVSDVKMVDTVVRNVLSNAIKFTPDGGTVELSVTQIENGVEIVVADTGIGIPAEELATLFQPGAVYRQLGTAGEKGTGLGLLLCKEFVQKCGGNIWIESEVGKGTTCRFTLSGTTASESFSLPK